MKRTHGLKMLFIVLMAFSIISCEDKNNNSSGISGQEWSDNATLVIPEGNILTVVFTANGNWTAKSGASWCKVAPTSGSAGKHTLEISATSSTTSTRTTSIIVSVNGSKSSNIFQVKQNVGDGFSEDVSVNTKVDEYLRKKYLWNEEYKMLSPNLNLRYDLFLKNTLMSMTTNSLDKKQYIDSDGKKQYSLFSYIYKKNKIPTSRATNEVHKEKEYNFGITGVIAIKNDKDRNIYAEIQGVYQESSAAGRNLKRGSKIYYINNEKITANNYKEKCKLLVSPSSNMTLTVGGIDNTEKVTISSAPIYANPVILTKVIEKGSHRIGYMVYAGFDAGFDQELFDAFKSFKSAGVTDFILDLRYNGGGHIISANLISSCIAGEACAEKTFVKYRYNAERMKSDKDSELIQKFSYNSYINLNKAPLSAGGLNLKQLYCLVSKYSASASELVINSLRGIDISVILIGETTHGKNVGMEPIDITENGETYELAPITFQSYNAKGKSDYEAGFAPNHRINEEDIDNDHYFDNYIGYAEPNEPLFSKAISLITGAPVPSIFQTSRSSRSTSPSKVLYLPTMKPTDMYK